ncbi:MAG TPA: TIGR04283 family arsenosugar biosynthesis glycosyltransferase [Thermoanaerobaculia bacterium]|nr:TIGR04283 family arsenosugar biosynthesis glycosyltransferase [Thermoanaerobaculia bacterium]
MISIIVPTRNEGVEIVEKFRQFCGRADAELLVADGGGSTGTAQAFQAIGASVLTLSGNRGSRLAAAATRARGDVLLFLHGDSRAPDDAIGLVRLAVERGAAAGAFSLAYDGSGRALSWIAWWANIRSRLLKLPFGDQGLFCRKDAYERAGGFRDLPICDDVDLVRRLARTGRFVILPEKTATSPRRYRERGALRQVLLNWKVLAGYYLGVSPATLDRWYNR